MYNSMASRLGFNIFKAVTSISNTDISNSKYRYPYIYVNIDACNSNADICILNTDISNKNADIWNLNTDISIYG